MEEDEAIFHNDPNHTINEVNLCPVVYNGLLLSFNDGSNMHRNNFEGSSYQFERDGLSVKYVTACAVNGEAEKSGKQRIFITGVRAYLLIMNSAYRNDKQQLKVLSFNAVVFSSQTMKPD